MGGKGGEAMTELRLMLRTLEDLVRQVERDARMVEVHVGPYRVKIYRVEMASGPIIRIDLRREEVR